MKHKLLNIVVFSVIVYLLPLWGHWEQILSIPLLFLLLKTIALVFTQPPITLQGVQTQAAHDRFSTLGIVLVYVGSQAAAMIEWMYVGKGQVIVDGVFVTGVIGIMGGLWFRTWCIRTLGRFFTSEVKIQHEQRIITSGAYQYVRHPSYLGAYVAIVGSTLVVHAYMTALATAVLLGGAYYYRIVVEEATLVAAFGEEYARYQKVSKRFLPFVY